MSVNNINRKNKDNNVYLQYKTLLWPYRKQKLQWSNKHLNYHFQWYKWAKTTGGGKRVKIRDEGEETGNQSSEKSSNIWSEGYDDDQKCWSEVTMIINNQ